MIEILHDIALRDPVLVLALSGWVDAGSAGASAATYLREHLDAPVALARVDLDDILDLQQTRPLVQLVGGVTRTIEWPEITFVAGRAGRDVIVCQGPEPSLRWRSLAGEVAELARLSGVGLAVALGGMPVPTTHRRPVRVLATASARSLAQEVDPVRDDYAGPTGFQTIVQHALGRAGVPAVGLWAQVPHYLAGTVSPPATRALLSRLREIAGVEVDLQPLDRQSEDYTRQVDETIAARPDLAELVARLDAQLDALASGDELASEIEQFLREER